MANFEESKAKIEAFLTKSGNLASVLPQLCSEGFLSKQEELEVSLTGPSRRAHTVTKILENKITSQPKLFVNLIKILRSHKFEEGSESDNDRDDSDLPLGMTTIMDEISIQAGSSLPADVEATEERAQLKTADTSKLKLQNYESFVESEIQECSTDSAVSLLVTHAATAATTHTVKSKARKPRSKPIASDVHFVQEKVYTKGQLQRLKKVEADYPGIDFSAYYSNVTIGDRGGVIRGEGIQLRIPPNAIGRHKSRTISLRACIDGPFQLPEGVHLTSPVFLVTCTPSGNFHREVTLTLHHFMQLKSHEQCEMMVLLTSPQRPVEDKDGKCWKFKISREKPLCFENFTSGEVVLEHFSLLCFGVRIPKLRRARVLPQSDPLKYHYRAFVYSPRSFRPPSCHILFSICLDHEVYRTRLQNMVDSSFDECNLEKMNDIPCSIEKEVKIIPPANAQGYQITSNQSPAVIFKDMVDRIQLRWWEKRRRGSSGDSPWILFTVSQTDPVRARGVHQLQFRVEGINSRAFDGFNLATHHATARIQASPVHRESVPAMPKLLNFKAGTQYLNIPREIGTSYTEFGIHLLQDDNGVRVRSLEHELHRAADDINRRILQEWLEGRGISPVSWGTLIDTLRTIELNELATLIEQHTVG